MSWKGMVLAIAAAALVAMPVRAGARVILEEHFDAAAAGGGQGVKVKTKHGQGWSTGEVADRLQDGVLLRFPAKNYLNAEAGTIEVEILRDGSSRHENIFTIVDSHGRNSAYATIDWYGFALLEDVPVLEFGGQNLSYRLPPPEGGDVAYVPLPGIAKGQSFHMAFTWGAKKNDCGIYLNGAPLPLQAQSPCGMTEIVKDAVSLVIGGEPAGESGANGQLTSTLEYLRVYDQAIPGSELYKPERYDNKLFGPLAVAVVANDAFRVAGFSGRLVADDTLNVTVQGTPGAAGTFDIVHYPDIDGKIALDWRGWGVYLEDKVFFEEGEVNLRDVEGYKVYVSEAPFDPAAPALEPVAELKVEEQSYLAERLQIDKPHYVAVVARMRDESLRTVLASITDRPLLESAPGVYTGSYRIGWQDRYARAVAVGRLARDGAPATLADTNFFAIDPALTLAVATEPSELKADEKSQAKVTVTVTNANGAAVAGHKVKFVLATTSQYTGVVGGGAFAEQVGGTIQESPFGGVTDIFGKLTTTYVAGFAAKTAVIVARDMLSNDTGAGYVKTFIQATAQLELQPVLPSAAMAEGYAIEVTSSDAWLTADGRSEARITARVTLGGQPVEGHKVGFGLASGTGTVRVVKDTTDRDGEARAVYTAGRKIGLVFITATDLTAGISGSVQIELRSDAPAKIKIKIDPEKLPADGRSRADLLVQVTDINDNPNDGVEVEYLLAAGGGRLRDKEGLTDRRGESTSQYTAGNSPGMVTIEITVRSTVPTDEELAKARGFALAVTDYKFF